MKKYLMIIVSILLVAFLFSACGKSTDSSKSKETKKQESKMSLSEVKSDATKLWNEVICEVSWYSGNGTSSTGKALDIDFVIENMDKYYNKLKDDKEYIDSLGDEYSDIKSAFEKMLDKATIICDHLRTETPKPNEELSYRDEIDLFHQYYQYFSDAVRDAEKNK